MNENRGLKTHSKDFKRTLILTKKQLKKIKQVKEENNTKQLKKLEKKVKQIQIFTFFKTVPIIISGTILKTIIKNVEQLTKVDSKKEEKNNKSNKDNKVLEDYITIKNEEKDDKKEIQIKQEKKSNVSKINILPTKEITITSKEGNLKKVENHNQKITKELDQLKNKKIIKSYEERLKEERTELKEIAANFPISKTGDDYYKKAEEVYQKINLIIKKLEDLERKIEIDDTKYDDAYVTYLIDYYTKEFKDGKTIKELKSSDLYISISKKLDQLEEEKKKLKELIKSCKEKRAEEYKKENNSLKNKEQRKETNFDYIKEEKEYNKFQEEQIKILSEKENKYNQAKTKYERVRIQVEALKKECQSLKRMITKRSLMKPTIRNAKLISISVLTSVFFMKLILQNKVFKNVRKTLKRRDYQKEIETNVTDINKTSNLMKQTLGQIENLIAKVKAYSMNYPMQGFELLLIELEDIKRILEEREYEINQIKNSQTNYQRENPKVYRK